MPSTGGCSGAASLVPACTAGSTLSDRCSAVVVVIHGLASALPHGFFCSSSLSAGGGVPPAFCASSARSLCSKQAIFRSRSSLVSSVATGFGGDVLLADWARAAPL